MARHNSQARTPTCTTIQATSVDRYFRGTGIDPPAQARMAQRLLERRLGARLECLFDIRLECRLDPPQ